MEINMNQIIEAYRRIAHISHYHVFILAVALDIFTGYIKAFITKDLDSKVGLTGIVKHLSIAGMVLLICPYLWLLGYGKIAIFLIYSIAVTYGISIIENIDVISPNTIPKSIGVFFRRVKEESDKIDLKDIKDIKDIKDKDKK